MSTVDADSVESLLGRIEYMRDRMDRFSGMVGTFDDMVSKRTSHIAQAASIGVALGAPMDVTVAWPGDGFADDQYEVDICPLGLAGKGDWSVIDKQPAKVTVRLTATIAVTAGTAFLVFGRS